MDYGMIAIILGALQGLIIVVGWFIKRTLASLEKMADDTLQEVRDTNGTVKQLQAWTSGHEKLDDERFKRTEETHRDIWERLNERE